LVDSLIAASAEFAGFFSTFDYGLLSQYFCLGRSQSNVNHILVDSNVSTYVDSSLNFLSEMRRDEFLYQDFRSHASIFPQLSNEFAVLSDLENGLNL
jgi:hypothetical protein